jgi:short-subunit dehydrogenase
MVMDVLSEESVAAGIDSIEKKEGGIDILVYAAGNGVAAPVETSGAEMGEEQFAVNFFGALRLLKYALPGMRERRRGMVVFVGSVAGEFPIPFQALYSASKAALAALCGGLRMEMAPFGVKAAVVMPGDIKTGFTEARRKSVPPDCYAAAMEKALSVMEKDERNGMPAETVARAIFSTARKKNPPAFVTVGLQYKLFVFLKRILPARAVEFLLSKMYL